MDSRRESREGITSYARGNLFPRYFQIWPDDELELQPSILQFCGDHGIDTIDPRAANVIPSELEGIHISFRSHQMLVGSRVLGQMSKIVEKRSGLEDRGVSIRSRDRESGPRPPA